MKRHKVGEWIPISERFPTKGEEKKYIILYYFPKVERERLGMGLAEIVNTDVLNGHREKTHWMKLDRPNEDAHNAGK